MFDVRIELHLNIKHQIKWVLKTNIFFYFKGCTHKIRFVLVYLKMCKIGGDMTFLMMDKKKKKLELYSDPLIFFVIIYS